MTDYRTNEQFTIICNNMLNGNCKDAGKNCVDFGFYANDLINARDALDYPEVVNLTDLVILTELVSELRYSD